MKVWKKVLSGMVFCVVICVLCLFGLTKLGVKIGREYFQILPLASLITYPLGFFYNWVYDKIYFRFKKK